MDYKDFEKLKERFSRANTDEKVSPYVNTPGLTKDQYRAVSYTHLTLPTIA